jgi:hypothetical protein
MFIARGSAGIAAVLAATLTMACARHRAPDGFLPIPEEAQQEASGAWIDVTLGGGSSPDRVAGELIAVSEDTIWILTEREGRAVATAAVVSGQLVAYDSQSGRVAAATFFGTLSTISNGAGLLLTAPMWIVGGSASASLQSRVPIYRLPVALWARIAPFARFPQGMPPGLELEALRAPPSRVSRR